MRRIVNWMLCASCSGLPLGKCWIFFTWLFLYPEISALCPLCAWSSWSKFRMFRLRSDFQRLPLAEHDQILPCFHDQMRPFPYLSMASLMAAWARNWRLGWKVWVCPMRYPQSWFFSALSEKRWHDDQPMMVPWDLGYDLGVPYFTQTITNPYFRYLWWWVSRSNSFMTDLGVKASSFCECVWRSENWVPDFATHLGTWFSVVGPWRSWHRRILSRGKYSDGGRNWFAHAHSSPVCSYQSMLSKCHSNFRNPISESLRVPGHTCFWCLNVCILGFVYWQAMSPLKSLLVSPEPGTALWWCRLPGHPWIPGRILRSSCPIC